MKLRALIGSLVLVFVWISAVQMVLAAPSLPVTKLPVTGAYQTGPNDDSWSTNGQWFLGPDGAEYRTHEFHDNVLGEGGGGMSHYAITGYVSQVVYGGSLGEITEFDITATIYNDTTEEVLPWMAGTNSHYEENNDVVKWYYGTLRDVKLSAEFAISSSDTNLPQSWTDPYFPSDGEDIVATNDDQLAWYCWNIEQQAPPGGGGPGGYHVPTWDFGNIPQGSSSTQILKFTVSGAGISAGDPRFLVIANSANQMSDILLNRTTSLKVSTWLDTIAPDIGIFYPHTVGEDPLRSSDVSVFHNEDRLDFGDAPYDGITNMYETLLNFGDGARHSIFSGVMMGAAIDDEIDGQPSVLAVGDDNLGTVPDDEDGVVPTSSLYPGLKASVDVTVSVDGYLNAWVDFGSDGSWSEAGDQIRTNLAVVAGVNSIAFAVPATASVGSKAYARFRFCTAPGVTLPNGYAPDGEVEDYMWVFRDVGEANDFGDAPDTYQTTMAATGAMHRIGGPWLGDALNGPDPEDDGQPDPGALGDDSDGFDDEHGVSIAAGTELVRGVPTTYSVEVGGSGWFQMWIDWDISGTFEPHEEVTNVFLTAGSYSPTLTAPMNAVAGNTFIRCRISVAGGLQPTGGPAPDGEVEDYALTVADGYVDDGNLQSPHTTTAIIGTPSEPIYGWVYLQGITDPAGQGAGINAQAGFGPDGSDADGTWTWENASYNLDQGTNDEYMTAITISSTGTYDYAYRYSRDGIDWTYGDIDGSGNGYTNTQAGSIVVTALSPFSITNVAMVATSDTATVWWDSEDRVVYQLQRVVSLSDTNLTWINVGGEVTGPTNMATDAGASATSLFYRIRAPYVEP